MSRTVDLYLHGHAGSNSTLGQINELAQATIIENFILERKRDDAGTLFSLEAGKHIVLVNIRNGPRLYLHPDSARDLFNTQQDGPADRGETVSGKTDVQPTLGWPGLMRPSTGRALDQAVVDSLSILKGDYLSHVSRLAASEVVRRVDAQVVPGMYALSRRPLTAPLHEGAQPVQALPPSRTPVLVLIHGTFSNTFGTFGKLWRHDELIDTMFDAYDDAVYALEHPTLAASPIENALALVEGLAPCTRLHLLTHSRGGLVAEVLARACAVAADQDGMEMFDQPEYAAQLRDLRRLVQLVRERQLTVERVVRVACPARGTLLASKRLDAYLSVLKWASELAGIPLAPTVIEFLGMVAQHRTEPETIPGLAAQMPDNPLIQWLHAAPEPVPGELRVVAGDVEGNSVFSWIKTLVSDAYFWQDNDFVVQTSSMYGGVPRKTPPAFVLTQGGDVSHFSYFARHDTAMRIVTGLVADDASDFTPIGPLSQAGKASSGTRALRAGRAEERPAVILLPGILGSHLAVDDKRIWLSHRLANGFHHLNYPSSRAVKPDGMIEMVYGDLIAFLEATHEVIEFSFDWRLPLDEEARRLAKVVRQNLQSRTQPVSLLAHSMGCILARTLHLVDPSVWEALLQRPTARFLMLGPPNAGSWAPMQVLSGDDDVANAIALFGAPFGQSEARRSMARYPGFLQLQAGLTDSRLRLDSAATWEMLAMRDAQLAQRQSIWHCLPMQQSLFEWGLPSQAVLDQAVELRRRLDAQIGERFPAPAGSVVMVVGQADFTPDGIEEDAGGLVYREAVHGGDGRVTLASALLPGVPTWKIDREHGDIPRAGEAFEAFRDLLLTGNTTRLPSLEAHVDRSEAPRAAERTLKMRRLRQHGMLRPDLAAALVSAAEPGEARSRKGPALEIQVVNGNLKFISQPILVGHYSASVLTGTEHALDQLVGGTLTATLKMGCYPNACGSHQVFLNLGQNLLNPIEKMRRPRAVIVVGLGLEGALKVEELAKSVTKGVIAWAHRLREEQPDTDRTFEMAATLMGSGGVNMSAESSARAVARGVRRANQKLAERGWPVVQRLHFVEVYLDRAAEALRALKLLAEADKGAYSVEAQIVGGIGAYRRALGSGYRGAQFDLISAIHERQADGTDMIVYSLNSRRAREDVHASRQQAKLIDLLIADAAKDGEHNNAHLGHTLFKLLVPPEIEPFLATSEDMQIELNHRTATIPWELLDSERDDPDGSTDPWAIRAKLLRCLRTVGLPLTVNDARGDANFLVIGEPESRYAPLPGARAEAIAVADMLEDRMGKLRVTRLIRDNGGRRVDAAGVIGALFEREWRVIHIAGHGQLPSEPVRRNGNAYVDDPGDEAGHLQPGSLGGVVLSDESFLGVDEISAIRTVPALVFLNCCHLAVLDDAAASSMRSDTMPSFAATAAEALIRKGVRCVLVAGWAVEDGAAQAFATTFYDQLCAGERFIDAVAAARRVARRRGGNTWAAYQCYGDPNWRLVSDRSVDNGSQAVFDEASEVVSPSGLILLLEFLVTSYRYDCKKRQTTEQLLDKLEDKFGRCWGGIGVVAEAFGLAWFELAEYRAAIKWLERAVAANDATASMRALEILAGVLARHGSDSNAPGGMSEEEAEQSRAQLERARFLLEKVVEISPTMERLAQLGGVHQQLAMLIKRSGSTHPDDVTSALRNAIIQYRKAQELGMEAGLAWFYPAGKALIAELVLSSSKGLALADLAGFEDYRAALRANHLKSPDFSSSVAWIETELYMAVSRDKLANESARILHEFRDLNERARGAHLWGAVIDQFEFVDLLWDRETSAAEGAARNEIRTVLRHCKLRCSAG